MLESQISELLRSDIVAVRDTALLPGTDMYHSLQMPVASTNWRIGLQNETLPQWLRWKATRKSSRNPVLFLIVCKKKSLDKEAEVSYARSTRALPMRLVTVRKSLDSGVQAVVDNYMGKVKRYCSFEELQIRPNPKNTSDVSAQVEAEGERVLRSIMTKDWVVLVDERGQDFTSEQFATSIAEAGDKGASALVFCIGGPYGHGSQVRQRANVSIKLSSMVLNHQGLDNSSRREISPLAHLMGSQKDYCRFLALLPIYQRVAGRKGLENV